MSSTSEPALEVSVTEVKQMQDASTDFLLLDVRNPDEYELCRIEGSMLLPMGELMDRIGEIEEHRDRPSVVHCHHGGRSMQVTQFLRQKGFSHVQNMAGGIESWSLEVDSAVPRY
ncbi:MAG: rhodanese-like domain-containing protein [Planctomycetota bacterium]